MKTNFIHVLAALACLLLAADCGKKPESAPDESAATGYYVSASNPEAVISETLQKLKGRWVRELNDPNAPNTPTMRLYAVADNTLAGRLLVAGAFSDVGMAAVLREDPGNHFTLTLRDDELRAHPPLPAESVFTGGFDAGKKTLTLKSAQGESIEWELPGGFQAFYSANIPRCVVIPTPVVSPSPSPAPLPSPAPSGTARLEASPGLGPRASSGATIVPAARLSSCGVLSTYRDEWSRMSGAE